MPSGALLTRLIRFRTFHSKAKLLPGDTQESAETLNLLVSEEPVP
jgi:hypothetical protein